jgi:thiol-disulfide isomerase/thioredoxin
MTSSASQPPVLVVCLCAQWCGSCRDYRSTFDEVAEAFPGMRFVWVDIEDEADFVDPVEVENFPTLLIASPDGARFFGPMLPHKETLVRLLQVQADTVGGALLVDADVQALTKRLQAREA